MASISKHWPRRAIKGPDGEQLRDPETGKRLWEKTGEFVWRARYRDAAGKEHTRHFDRQVDAKRWLDEVTASVITGMYVDPNAGKVTFKQYVSQWQPRQVWETNTAAAFTRTIDAVPFADDAIGVIRRSHVEAWIKAMSSRYAPTTIKTAYVHVRQVFRAAVRDRVIPEDPSADVTLPRMRRAEHAMLVPTPEQVQAVLAECDPQFRPYVELCAFAGLRAGEASAVKFEDIDFLGRQLHVRRQRQRDEVRPPKWGSERTVFLPDDLVTSLSVHMSHWGSHPDGWLFIGERGPAGDNWATARFRKARKAAEVENITIHSLRHFYASGLIAAGCDVVTVQRALGHASATTTLSTYAHLWPTAEDRTRSAAAEIMRQVESATEPAADSVRIHR